MAGSKGHRHLMKAHKLSLGSQGRKIFKGFVATWPGKGRPGQRFRPRHPRWICRLAAFAALVGCAVIPSLLANPTGESVRHGQATFTRSGSNLIIEQGSDKLVVNWKDFSISSAEITKFIQPGYPTIWGVGKIFDPANKTSIHACDVTKPGIGARLPEHCPPGASGRQRPHLPEGIARLAGWRVCLQPPPPVPSMSSECSCNKESRPLREK